MRQRRAKLGTNQHLKENDGLNVITTWREVDERRRTDQEGIDFVFNDVEPAVHFRCHRCQHAANDEQGEPVHLLDVRHLCDVLNLAQPQHESDDDSDKTTTQGSVFEWGQGRLFKVLQTSDDEFVHAVCLAPSRVAGNAVQTADLHAVSHAMHTHNS
jgi:hypothetical protein